AVFIHPGAAQQGGIAIHKKMQRIFPLIPMCYTDPLPVALGIPCYVPSSTGSSRSRDFNIGDDRESPTSGSSTPRLPDFSRLPDYVFPSKDPILAPQRR